MSKNNTSSSTGLGLSSVLTIVFVVLKLVGTINWSWWWIFSPLLIDAGLIIIGLIILAVCIACDNKKYGLTSKKGKKDKWKF